MSVNSNIESIIKYIDYLCNIKCSCEFVKVYEIYTGITDEFNETVISEDYSYYRVIIPKEYNIFRRSIQIDLNNKFINLNIICELSEV